MSVLTPAITPSVPRNDAPPTPSAPVQNQPQLYRMSAATYQALTASGTLGPDDHVELLEGLLVQRMSKNPPHEAAIRKLRQKLAVLVPPTFLLDVQAPLDLNESQPEPDLSIVLADPTDYASRHPSAAQTLLVIEVADTSLQIDLGIKLRTYARAGIPQYWVINLPDRRIELYTQPDPAANPPVYNLRQPFGPDTQVPLNLPGLPTTHLPVAELLP